MKKIYLTAADARVCFAIARQRYNDNLLRRRSDYNGAQNRQGELLHIIGMLGEFAVSQVLGLTFSATDGLIYKANHYDLLDKLEIRTRGKLAYDYLYIHEKDHSDLYYVHCALDSPALRSSGMYYWRDKLVEVRGWIHASDALRLRERQNFGNANWCCHQRHLHPMSTFPFIP